MREGLLRLCRDLGDPYRTIEAIGGWWDRRGETEVDLVGTNSYRVPIAIGSVKWRHRRAFDSDDLADLTAARAVVPDAGAAKLVAICPSGVRSGISVDVALGASELLAAWRQDS